MLWKVMKIVAFLLLLPFGAVACTRKPTAVPTASVSYETAMKAVGELAETVKEQGKLIEELIATSGSTLKLVTELQSAVQKVEEFRASNPEIHRRLTENSSDKLMFQCSGYVQAYGLADLFKLGSRTLFCTQPGIARPLDGAACYNVPNTRIWDCGTGQVLMECIYCGCPTPTAVPPTGVPPTFTVVPPTAVPPTGVPPTFTVVPPTAVPPTGVPPTNGPPGGTATCEPTPTRKPCEDQNVDFWAEPVLDPDDFGTRLKVAGNGHHVRLSDTVNWQKVQEEVRMCQVHVVSAHSIHDLIAGRTLTGCVIAYRQGLSGDDSYHQVRYEAIDGYGYHINTPQAGFGLQEGGTQVKKALLTARKADGSYACRIPGDQNRPNAQDIQLMELGLEGP